MVLTLLAGYLGPAVAGIGAAVLLVTNHALGLLWLLLAWLLLMLAQVRNAYGVAVLMVCLAILAGVSWYLPATAQSAVAYLITWVLLVSAPKPVVELAGQRRARRVHTSDADQLGRLTRLPAGVWIAIFLVANTAGLVVGAGLLVPAVKDLLLSLVSGLRI